MKNMLIQNKARIIYTIVRAPTVTVYVIRTLPLMFVLMMQINLINARIKYLSSLNQLQRHRKHNDYIKSRVLPQLPQFHTHNLL